MRILHIRRHWRIRLLSAKIRLCQEESFDPPSPGEKTVKEPRAVNTGKTNCYVRAKVLLSDSRVQSFLTYVNEGNTGEGLWIKNKDGWLYYDRILETSKKQNPFLPIL